MSVKFDPINDLFTGYTAPNASYRNPISKFFRGWMDMVYEGNVLEASNSKEYCSYKWKQLSPSQPTRKEDPFMKECMDFCEQAKQFAYWHRLN